MSRLSIVNDEPVDPNTAARRATVDLTRSVIRNRRKRPLHPDTITDMLRAKAALRTAKALDFGWLLILWDIDDGRRHARHLPPGTTYAGAVFERDEEMATGDYEKAWLIKKTGQRE